MLRYLYIPRNDDLLVRLEFSRVRFLPFLPGRSRSLETRTKKTKRYPALFLGAASRQEYS